jgi:putative membrane protein
VKTILRKIAIYTFTLSVLPVLVPGVTIDGGLETLFIGGSALALMFLVVKPVLNIISFPVNLVTLGLFSVITNGFILYLMTRFVEGILIASFSYPATNMQGFVTPEIHFNTYTSYIFTAFVISVIESSLSWLMD